MNFKLRCTFLIAAVLIFPVLLSAEDSRVLLNQFVHDIQIQGLDNLKRRDLPALERFSSKIGLRLTEKALVEDINQLYLTGYFNSVKATTIPTGNRIVLTFFVEENPTINTIAFINNSIFSDAQLHGLIKHRPGDVLNLSKLDRDRTALTEHYRKQGYDLFEVLSVHLSPDQTLTFTLSEGRIQDITFIGLKHIEEPLITRDIFPEKNPIFNSLHLRRKRERLLKTGYFSDVSAPLLTEGKKGSDVVVSFRVTEKKINLLDFGFEQEDELIVGFMQSKIHHLPVLGDQLTGKVQVSNENAITQVRSYALGYQQPWLFGSVPISLAINAFSTFRNEFLTKDIGNETLFETHRLGGDAIFGISVLKDVLQYSTKFRIERVAPKNGSAFSSYTIRSITGILNYSSVAEYNNPSKGTYWRMSLEKGGNLGIVDLKGLEFSRGTFNAATFFNFGKKHIVGIHGFAGIFRPNLSQIDTFETEGFDIGGSNSLRGYKENDILPSNRKILFNLEYRHTFNGFFQGVLFADIGRVFDEGFSLQPNTFTYGKGLGFRLFTPMGPLRFDFAWGNEFIIHFGIGQVF